MVLRGSDGLDKDAGRLWRKETESRIWKETEAIIGDDGEELDVDVDFENQELVGRRMLLQSSEAALSSSVDSELTNQHGYLRKLESSSLQITFTTNIEFNSAKDSWDPNDMVAAGFRTVDQQNDYLGDLKDADSDSFGTVNSMAMEVDGEVITETEIVSNPAPSGPAPQSFTLYIIIAGAVGGVVLMLLAVVIYRKKSSSSTPSPKSQPQDTPTRAEKTLAMPPKDTYQQQPAPTTATTLSALSPPPPAQNYFGTIETREGPADDVSTIGDPYFGEVNTVPHADATVGESMISSEQQMYEYGVRRGRLGTGGGSTLNTTGQSTIGANMYKNMFADDNTLEGVYRSPINSREENGSSALRQLTVVAPEGKLGIVVDNQTGDMPIVHAIKETSALKGKVSVGDFLISVDEVDCRGMSAVQVSKLISNRSRNPARTLVLLRGSGGC